LWIIKIVDPSRIQRFQELCDEARRCRICPKLADKNAVLSDLNGTLTPKVLFVAEAPGRQGADRTRRPFYGDKSGANLQVLLDSIGLARDEIFITNAVMCSPRTATGANRKPTRTEMANCSGFLRRLISTIDPPMIATLGSVALEALKAIEYHEFRLKTDVGRVLNWSGRRLVPLYHPSPQVIASHRRMNRQLEDFAALSAAISE
jgi:uracil-DNA glycosylase